MISANVCAAILSTSMHTFSSLKLVSVAEHACLIPSWWQKPWENFPAFLSSADFSSFKLVSVAEHACLSPSWQQKPWENFPAFLTSADFFQN